MIFFLQKIFEIRLIKRDFLQSLNICLEKVNNFNYKENIYFESY